MTDRLTPRASNALAWGITTLWATTIVAIAANDGFAQNPGSPPGKLAIAFFTPVAVFALGYRLLPGLRAWVATQDMALLIGMQTWRVLGMVFLFLLGLGLLPATFAIPAGMGDVAVGIFALFVLVAVMRKTPGWVGQARWLVVVGVLDFVVAIGTATLSGAGGLLHLDGAPLPILMQSLPMVLIPAFLVPLFLIAHLMVWLKLPAAEQASLTARQPMAR